MFTNPKASTREFQSILRLAESTVRLGKQKSYPSPIASGRKSLSINGISANKSCWSRSPESIISIVGKNIWQTCESDLSKPKTFGVILPVLVFGTAYSTNVLEVPKSTEKQN